MEPSAFGVAASMSLIEMAEAHDSVDALDDYFEAQVHGLVRLDRHAEALVLDPSHRGTAVEDAARGLRCPVEWHPGFRLTVDELRRHPDYRGPEYVDLGAEIAVDGRLDPRIIGDAARTGRYDPQALKRVWHDVARFGAPLQAAGDLSARAREGRHAASRDPDASQEGRVSFGRTYPLRSTGAPAERLTVRRPRAGTRHGAAPGADRGMRRSAVELRAPTTGRVRANCPR